MILFFNYFCTSVPTYPLITFIFDLFGFSDIAHRIISGDLASKAFAQLVLKAASGLGCAKKSKKSRCNRSPVLATLSFMQ